MSEHNTHKPAWWWVNADDQGRWHVSTSSAYDTSLGAHTWAIVRRDGAAYHAVVFCHRVDAEQCAINAWKREGFSRAPQHLPETGANS